MLLLEILQVNVKHIHSSSEPFLLVEVSKTCDPKTFHAKVSVHPNWDSTMNEEYCSLMENYT